MWLDSRPHRRHYFVFFLGIARKRVPWRDMTNDHSHTGAVAVAGVAVSHLSSQRMKLKQQKRL